MKTLLTSIILLIGFSLSAAPKTKTKKEMQGDKYYFVYSFDKAINSYTHSKTLSVEGQRRLAISYHSMDQNIQSEAAYATLINTSGGNLADDYFNYAMVLKSNGKIQESGNMMEKLNQQYPGDLRGKDFKAHQGELAMLSKDDGKFGVTHLDVNTDAQDFGPCYYKSQIVFTSSRSNKLNPRKYNWNGLPFLDMYVCDVNQDQLKDADIFDKSLDGKMHDGPASFNKAGTFMAFTRNNYDLKRKDRVVNIEICFSTFANGKWSEPVPFSLNNKEYSVGHPCLSADGNTMYFSSNMPGGFGGADLYRITRSEGGEWGKAENLGDKINTEGDEVFPFFEESNEVLFFASNGRYGLGGLDIFICARNGSSFGNVVNAGAPLNTASDDFGVIVDDQLTKGYFSSNRTGGSGSDDLYSVDLLKDLGIGKRIRGIAKDKFESPLPKTFITLYDDKGNVMDTVTTKDDGAYTFLVASDKNFKLTGNKLTYNEGSTPVTTTGKEFIVKADITLLKKDVLVVIDHPVGTDLGTTLNPVYFDLDKFNIRPDAATELDKIVAIMNANPTMVVELGSYTDCRETKEYNQILSDKRAKASVDYIKARITNPSRITGKGYSESKLTNSCGCEGTVVSDCSEEEHQKNRRTEFIIIKK
jgi:outer membrane protein OmpA-like peptidoglycan-associated protein